MTRVASLYLPQLPIERLRRLERPTKQPSVLPLAASVHVHAADDDPGACSVPRGGGWRPGARWARDGVPINKPSQSAIDALPAHQRPTMREMGRRSEPADHPFRTLRCDDGAAGTAPAWSILAKSSGDRPMVLIERSGQRDVITAACPVALELGLRSGMAAAHARALVADLEVRDAERDNDRAFLDRTALHAIGHWTPTACVSGSDGLWLDLTGSAHLFGGELRFCQRVIVFLQRLGFTATIAIAGTPGAAHALARYGDKSVIVLPSGTETQAIADLPVASLRLTGEALTAASGFGLERVADLYPIPRGPLAKRLGLDAVRRLDQARGLVGEPITPVVPFEEPRVERRLLEPILTPEAIAHVIGDLVDDLVQMLQARSLGVRALVLTCLRVDSDEQRIGLGTSRATRDGKHLKRMLTMRIDRIAPGMGIEAAALAAPRVEDLQPVALSAPFLGDAEALDVAPLIDQLAGRAGEDALFRLSPLQSDVPERAVLRAGVLANPTGWPAWKRPVRLLRRPEPLSGVVALLPDHPPRRFAWRGQAYRVIAGDGPERVHGEWWRSTREMWAVRDYFRVEAEAGERFWIFRRGDGVDAPTGDLSWYMHGLFG